jgi:cytoplasmic iron level regulating protein YaaA (DUF328/UPF0246 family)
MRILLPPSEKKRTPTSSKALNLAELSFASELTHIRAKLLAGLPGVISEPAGPAITVYSGVLYKALGWESLKETDRARARESIVISSALFGALKVDDEIPNYKLKVKTGHWKTPLEQALFNLEDKLIVDCRSSTYATMWKSNPHITTGIRVFELRKGKRQVITHMAKKTRGEIARFLIQEEVSPESPEALLTVLAKKFNAELAIPKNGKGWFLDVLVQPNS